MNDYFHLSADELKEFDLDMFTFYNFDKFKSVFAEAGDYGGIPDYRNIINRLRGHQNCFVFAEYFTHMSVYAIRLYEYPSEVNQIYAIIGDKYKVVANSFAEFIELFKRDMYATLF